MFILEAVDRFDREFTAHDPFALYNAVSLAARKYWDQTNSNYRHDRNLFVAAILQREFNNNYSLWVDCQSDWFVVLSAFFGNVAGAKILRAWLDAVELNELEMEFAE